MEASPCARPGSCPHPGSASRQTVRSSHGPKGPRGTAAPSGSLVPQPPRAPCTSATEKTPARVRTFSNQVLGRLWLRAGVLPDPTCHAAPAPRLTRGSRGRQGERTARDSTYKKPERPLPQLYLQLGGTCRKKTGSRVFEGDAMVSDEGGPGGLTAPLSQGCSNK